jgi:oligopeptide/dipeptide ABC transporter ATP-binding protein
MILAARNLTLGAGSAVFPVWEVDLCLGKGERLAVVGESGGGKTSLAWALTGRPLPGQAVLAGEVSFSGIDLMTLSKRERAGLYYCRIALVPQNAQSSFHPAQRLWKSAGEIMAREARTKPDQKAVLDTLEPFSLSLDLPLKLWQYFPHQLSGGQKQRMALILALLNNPEALLLDEPTNALDELTRDKAIGYLEEKMAASHASAVLFTHDIGMASHWAERIAVLYRGEIIEELPSETVENPVHPYTIGLMGAAVRLGDLPLSRDSIPGHALPLTNPPKGCSFVDRCPDSLERCRRERPRLQGRGRHKVRCFMV